MNSLTDRQRECLRWLDDELWLRPMDMGATDGSHHSRTLRQLVDKGLADRKSPGGRSGCRYRRTKAGRAHIYATKKEVSRG